MNRVRLNLAAYSPGDPPNLGEPYIVLDGVVIDRPISIEIIAAGGHATTVRLTFIAQVEGDVEADDDMKPDQAVN